jgi:hypothetical protein
MDVDTLSGLIKAFFDVYQTGTVVGIVLPPGWFGRPYDNYYTLISIDIDSEAGKLSLDLSSGWLLSFEPVNAKLNESRRELTVPPRQSQRPSRRRDHRLSARTRRVQNGRSLPAG